MKKLVAMVSIYESGDWLENRLDNLKQSTLGKDLEIWCVNADSPDPRDDKIPKKFNVKYVKLKKRNTVYEAWNYIIQNSNSQYITNANTDDLIAPGAYLKMITAIEKNREAGFAYCNWYVTAKANQKFSKAVSLDPSGRPGRYNGDLQRSGVGHFPLWKRSMHDKCGMFDTKFQALSDADWWARCYFVGKAKFVWVDEFLAIYLWRNGQNLWQRKVNSEEWQRYHTKLAKYRKGKLE